MQTSIGLANLRTVLLIFLLSTLSVSAAAPQDAPLRHIYTNVGSNHTSKQPLLQQRFYPFAPNSTLSALPVEPSGQTYTLGPGMTINSNLIVSDNLSGGNSLPLLLDTLSACTWLPTKSMRCYDTSNPSSNANNTTNAKEGESCIGISAVVPHAANKLSSPRDVVAADGSAQVACSHNLAGFVSGPLLRTELAVAGKAVSDAQVLFAEGFHSKYGLSLHEFSQYYGGAVGVLGLGMYDALWDATSLVKGEQKWSGDLTSGLLRSLWLQDGEEQKNSTDGIKRVWSMALPRQVSDEDHGRFVIGGLVSNESAATTGDEMVVPLSRRQGWEKDGLLSRMLYGLPRISFDTDGSNTATSATEEYFFDSALPVIYTSESIAESVSSQFSPPGTFDNDTRLFMVDCNAIPADSVSMIIDNGYERNLSVPIYPDDLIVPLLLDTSPGGSCMSAFQVHADFPEWRRLGWPFFRNIVLTVDVGNWSANISVRAWPESSQRPLDPSPSSAPPVSSNTSVSIHPVPASTVVLASTPIIVVTESRTVFVTAQPPPSVPDVPGGSRASAPSSDPLHISFPQTITAIPSSVTIPPESIATPPGMTTIRTPAHSEATTDNTVDFITSAPPLSFPFSSEDDSGVVVIPVATSGPASLQRRGEGEARSVADEVSGTRDRRKRRENGGRDGGRWWPRRWTLRRRAVRDGEAGRGGGQRGEL